MEQLPSWILMVDVPEGRELWSILSQHSNTPAQEKHTSPFSQLIVQKTKHSVPLKNKGRGNESILCAKKEKIYNWGTILIPTIILLW